MSSKGIDDKLRSLGYNAREIEIYDRLGPKARAVIYNAQYSIDLVSVLQKFHAQRKIPDPIQVNGEFYPRPRATVYEAGEGDDEFAVWLVINVFKHKQRSVDLVEAAKPAAARIWDRDLDL